MKSALAVVLACVRCSSGEDASWWTPQALRGSVTGRSLVGSDFWARFRNFIDEAEAVERDDSFGAYRSLKGADFFDKFSRHEGPAAGRSLVGPGFWARFRKFIDEAEGVERDDSFGAYRSLKGADFFDKFSRNEGPAAGRSLVGPGFWARVRSFIDEAEAVERDDMFGAYRSLKGADFFDKFSRNEGPAAGRSLVGPDMGEDIKAPNEGKRSLAEESPGIQGLPAEGTTATKKRSLLAEGRER